MTIFELGALGELAGAIGVLLTLIFLTIQIRQNTRQLEHNSDQEHARAELESARLAADWHRTVVESPELVRLWGEHMANGASALKGEERARLIWLIAQYFYVIEGFYRQHLRGFLAPDSWDPYEKVLSGLLQMPLVSDFMNSRTSAYSEDFRRLCERLIESPHEAEWRYTALETFGMSGPAA